MDVGRCSICPARYRCVEGDGPLDARVVCIGEAPGRTEDEGGRPFIGEAGKEFNSNYLNLAGLYRSDIYITNTVKCRPDLNRKPSPTEVAGCSRHFLPAELDSIAPEVVILMGATPCSLLTGDDAIDLEADHGIPRLGTLFGWYGWIVPMYHPASGLHDSAMMIPMLEDWEKLKPWLEDDRWMWAEDKWQGKRDYALIETKQSAEEYLQRCTTLSEPLLIGGDTESHNRQPYSWQVSMEPGVARMLMLNNVAASAEISGWIGAQVGFGDARFVFHNAPADIDIFETQLGFSLYGLFDDTMQQAYAFGNLRQGLKSLARRLLGRRRLSWEETVTPYSKEVLGAWLQEGFVYAEQHWQIHEERWHKKTNKPLKTKVHRSTAEKLLVELYGYMLNNPDYKIWDKLVERMPEDDLTRLIAVSGPVPMRGIAHCPTDVQIEYGCSDPDDTRQLAVLFKTMRHDFIENMNFQDEDRDV